MTKIMGWLFKDSKGMQVELVGFGPEERQQFPKGGWILATVGAAKVFVILGPGPIEHAWHAARRELDAQGYQLYKNFSPTRY
jgi:hypothetical protein